MMLNRRLKNTQTAIDIMAIYCLALCCFEAFCDDVLTINQPQQQIQAQQFQEDVEVDPESDTESSTASNEAKEATTTHIKKLKDLVQSMAEKSIWNSDPTEVKSAKLQILDKISGNVARKTVNVGESLKIDDNTTLTLKRAFQNSANDSKEVYAFVEIVATNGDLATDNPLSESKTRLNNHPKVIFAQWLFASSPSINILEHEVYDVRVVF